MANILKNIATALIPGAAVAGLKPAAGVASNIPTPGTINTGIKSAASTAPTPATLASATSSIPSPIGDTTSLSNTATNTATNSTGSTGNTGTALPTQGTSSSPMLLQQVLGALNDRYQSNNVLMTQRNLALKQLYDQPLTPQELNQLDPNLRQAIESGDRNQVDMQLRLINDQVAGRTNSLDQSIHYLTNAYQDELANADKQKQQAVDTILNYSKNFVDPSTGQVDMTQFKKAITQLYGPEYEPLVDSIQGLVSPTTFRDTNNSSSSTSTETTTSSTTPSVGSAEFYKVSSSANPNQVYTKDGKAIDLPTFKQMTGQVDTPDNQVNFASVKTINPVQTASTGKKVTLTEGTNKIDKFIQQGNKALGFPGVGTDGYVSPMTYNAARDAWIKDNLPVSTFDTRFAKYVNPADPLDYHGVKPPVKKASTISSNKIDISQDVINKAIQTQ